MANGTIKPQPQAVAPGEPVLGPRGDDVRWFPTANGRKYQVIKYIECVVETEKVWDDLDETAQIDKEEVAFISACADLWCIQNPVLSLIKDEEAYNKAIVTKTRKRYEAVFGSTPPTVQIVTYQSSDNDAQLFFFELERAAEMPLVSIHRIDGIKVSLMIWPT